MWAATTIKWVYWISINLLDLEELVDDSKDSHQPREDVVVLAPLQLLLDWVPDPVQDIHELGLLRLSSAYESLDWKTHFLCTISSRSLEHMLKWEMQQDTS